MATVAEIATHLDLSERRVYEYQAKGVIPKAAPGAIDLDEARVAYLRHLRELASGRPQEGELDPAQERARKDRALAEQTELKNDIARGEVVEIEAVVTHVVSIFSTLRTKILGLPSKASGRVPTKNRAELHSVLESSVHELLEELSHPDNFPVVKQAKTKQARARRHDDEKDNRSRDSRRLGRGHPIDASPKGRGRGPGKPGAQRPGRANKPPARRDP